MFIFGNKRYLTFRIVDIDDLPITGRKLQDLSVLFLRNNEPCTDPLELRELGLGRYVVMYTPSVAGHDYLEVKDIGNDITVVDEEDILSQDGLFGGGGAVVLDQDYGGANALAVTEANPEQYHVLVYDSNDWDSNRRGDSYALGSTAVSRTGQWLSQIPVPKGTYHVVIKAFRTSKVIKPYLKVQ